MKKITASLTVMAVLALGAVPIMAAKGGRATLPTIAEIAAGDSNFSTLVAALSKAGLVDTFFGNRHFTVFAPTNEAFDNLAGSLGFNGGASLVAALDGDALAPILLYHVTRGDRNATSVIAAGALRMLDGNAADIWTDTGMAYIENAQIVLPNLRASNGIIHVINAVILPPAQE